MNTSMNKTKARRIIKDWADERGFRYRITARGCVDFYGAFPNASAAGCGWWNGGDWLDMVEDITLGIR